MSPRTIRHRIAATCVAVLAACAVTQAPQAHAQERNMVIFGDSVIADPNAP